MRNISYRLGAQMNFLTWIRTNLSLIAACSRKFSYGNAYRDIKRESLGVYESMKMLLELGTLFRSEREF